MPCNSVVRIDAIIAFPFVSLSLSICNSYFNALSFGLTFNLLILYSMYIRKVELFIQGSPTRIRNN